MPDSTNPRNPEATSPQAPLKLVPNKGLWLATLGLTGLWVQLIWFLRYSWAPESSYNYGWLVPPLTALLLYLRLKETPRIEALSSSAAKTASIVLIFLCLVGFLVARLLIEVNPFWRLPLWLGAGCLVVASIATLALSGGWALARKATYPLLFSLTMVPWPSFIEKSVINAFTTLVTHVSVISLQFLGHPAEQFGNIIQVGELSVGVEEACSGIKSLQGLGMMALFVGAFWKLLLPGRIGLIIWAIAITTFFNLARSLTLSLIVINGGQSTFDEWHDTVGYAAFGFGLVALFFIGSRMQSKPESPAKLSGKAPLTFPFKTGIAITVLALAPWLITEVWYGGEREQEGRGVDWIVDTQGFATDQFEIQSLPIHERITEILGYDYGYHLAVLKNNQRFAAEIWHYGYTGESKSNSLGAYAHSPTICMTASGATLKTKNDPLIVDLGALAIPFQHYVFRLPNGQSSQVFWCLWDDLFQGKTETIEGRDRLAQFASAFERQRSFKRKVALLGLPGENQAEARKEVTKIVRELFLLQKDGKTFRFQ